MLTLEVLDTCVPEPASPPEPVVDVVVPVLNEVRCLEASIRRLRAHLDAHLPFPAVVTIADNGSTDGTFEIAERLWAELPGIRLVHLDERGRGRALRAAWLSSAATVVAYMDVDLSTDLDAVVPLLLPLVAGTADVAIGSRLASGAEVTRSHKRELISRSYNRILRATLHNRFTDAQCGFKALRRSAAERLLPRVEDEGWFFDTELLVRAEREGLRIHEVPVRWIEDGDSRVRIVHTAIADLRGIRRLRRSPGAGGSGAGDGRFRLRSPGSHGWIVAAIAALATVLYTWSLDSVGWGNEYYAAAVRSATVSWKAFFFGSLDPGSFVTVDKPPAALWVQALSARVFGFDTWSILLPEALAGVASVLILHRLVRKWAGDVPAHLASLGLALTPVAVVMFRYNNPDAFLTLLCLGAAWAWWCSLESGRLRGLLLSGALLGLAFDTKMLQAFLVVPAFAAAYLCFGPARLARRAWQIVASGGVMLACSSWWVVIVALFPASARPYIGSTTDNSIVSLIFGYNGLSRIFGNGGGGGGGAGFGGTVSWLRMFNPIVGGQISWLLPLAGTGLAAGVYLASRKGAGRLQRAGWTLWGGWALVTLVVFSRAAGIFHPYYTVQAAPAIAALGGAGAVALWRLGRTHHALCFALPVSVLGTGIWAAVLLDRTPGYDGWLAPAVVVAGVLAAAGLLAAAIEPMTWLAGAAACTGVIALLAGPSAYALTTIANPSAGGDATAGPAVTVAGAPGLAGGAGGAGGAGAGALAGAAFGGPGGGGGGPGGAGGAGPGAAPGEGPLAAGAGLGGASQPPAGAVGRAGKPGGPGGATTADDAALVSYLEAHRGNAEYLVAGFTSMVTAQIIIDSGDAVVTIGGFNGSDPTPTLAQFEAMVAKGEVRYVLVDGSGATFGGPGGGSSDARAVEQSIDTWVLAHGRAVPASGYGGSGGGTTLYQLAA